MKGELKLWLFITITLGLFTIGCGAKGDLYLEASELENSQFKEKVQ